MILITRFVEVLGAVQEASPGQTTLQDQLNTEAGHVQFDTSWCVKCSLPWRLYHSPTRTCFVDIGDLLA